MINELILQVIENPYISMYSTIKYVCIIITHSKICNIRNVIILITIIIK